MATDTKTLTPEDLQAVMALLDDVRCEVIEAHKSIETTSATLLRRLDEPVVPGLQGSIEEILQVVRTEHTRAPLDLKKLIGIGLGLLLLGGSLGWVFSPTPRGIEGRARLMDQVNAVLVERQSGLAAEVKAKLAVLYRQQGFAPLDQQGAKP